MEERTTWERYHYFFKVCNEWLTLHENGKTLYTVLRNYGVKTISILGMGDICRHIIKELEDTDISIVQIIDKKRFICFDGLEVIDYKSNLKKSELLICTDIKIEKEVIASIKNKIECTVVSIEDVVYDNL